MVIGDDKIALNYISYVGHFRLKGYWYPLQDVAGKSFLPNTTFEQVVQRYECDREIRAIIMASVERLEVAVRTVICNLLSLKYSPHWYLKTEIFAPKGKVGLGQMLSKIEGEVERASSRLYIKAC
ncbi:Abi family protein [Pseudomonas sp. KU26590]|uniref:Abi family protein n=1 Tax=Pseudomonas sp. KU26590 TaxID=2991051 RepID=UPI0039FDC52E